MKKYAITTQSESGDDYIYFVITDKKMDANLANTFLKAHAYDKDEDMVYEAVVTIKEICDDNFIEI